MVLLMSWVGGLANFSRIWPVREFFAYVLGRRFGHFSLEFGGVVMGLLMMTIMMTKMMTIMMTMMTIMTAMMIIMMAMMAVMTMMTTG